VKNRFQSLPFKRNLRRYTSDAILDPHAIASHVLNRDAADVLWLEGFAHGGAVQLQLCVTHSLKATGFKPSLTLTSILVSKYLKP
jgi:hypothetical protein